MCGGVGEESVCCESDKNTILKKIVLCNGSSYIGSCMVCTDRQ